MKKIFTLVFGFLLLTLSLSAQSVLYSNTFEAGAGDATIIGSGQIVSESTSGFGNVFHNAVGGQAIRSNYLQLPTTVLSDLQDESTTEMTISFWVNVGTATDYFFSPIFSAYGDAPINGENTWPMFILQTRGLAQVNCAGWSNFDAAQNNASVNTESTAWLEDGLWHLYTAVYTTTSLTIYIDDVVLNAWTLDNTTDGQVIGGMFTNGSELDYICLGGNQAWDWADIDAAFKYDDITVYSDALTTTQIAAIITAKTTTTNIEQEINQGEIVSTTYFSANGSNAGTDFNALSAGIYIKKEIYSNGSVITSKIIK